MAYKIPVIAVLLTCYNRKEKTVSCLNLLFKQQQLNSKFKIEVFLVDDNSSDGTSEKVSEIFPSVNIIHGDGNLYWNRGMHLAWKTARDNGDYDFYIWLNDDTELLPGAINELLECYTLGGDKSIICGVTCSEETGNITYGGTDLAGKQIIPNGKLQQCEIMNGNCVLISKAVLNDVGFNDPVFIHSIGDFDYGFRAKKRGYTIFITRNYIAYCEKHVKLPKWCLPEVNYRERFKTLYSPLGNAHPFYFFIYEKRHFGLLTASKHFLSIHLRALIPSLWK